MSCTWPGAPSPTSCTKGTSVTEPPTTWLCTGISWRGGRPALTLLDPDGRERSRPLTHCDPLGLRLADARRCIGIWHGETRRCPFAAEIEHEATDPQCDACARSDPGRALARDTVRDPRPFRLYLAWLGPDLFKVGISAVERGNDRLLEQGALAFTWLACGDHADIRVAEQAVAATGLAAERRRRASKLAAWQHALTRAERAAALQDVHRRAQATRWPNRVHKESCEPVDHVAVFGLDRIPAVVDDIAGLRVGSVVSGPVAAVVGPELVLEVPNAAVVVSGRRLAGWPVTPTTEPPGGYTSTPLDTKLTDADQPYLF